MYAGAPIYSMLFKIACCKNDYWSKSASAVGAIVHDTIGIHVTIICLMVKKLHWSFMATVTMYSCMACYGAYLCCGLQWKLLMYAAMALYIYLHCVPQLSSMIHTIKTHPCCMLGYPSVLQMPFCSFILHIKYPCFIHIIVKLWGVSYNDISVLHNMAIIYVLCYAWP